MRKGCSVKGCTESVVGRGLCRKHYMRQRRKGSTDDKRRNAASGLPCAREGCDRPRRSGEWCDSHRPRAKVAPADMPARQGRICEWCAKPIPVERNLRARFCSVGCKTAAGNAPTPERKARLRAYYFNREYGLTLEECAALLESQGGCCAICGTAEPGGRHGTFSVDHDHKTGAVRGMLCPECNYGLGKFQDSPDILRKAIAYLER